jgi:hypothetical protein
MGRRGGDRSSHPRPTNGPAGGGSFPAVGQVARRQPGGDAPLIAEAAAKKADLVVLGETLTYINTKKSYADCAEPIPGPSTEFFGDLAKKHNL